MVELTERKPSLLSSGSSTADVVQIKVRMKEDIVECKRRVNDEIELEKPVARLLDLEKVYP